MMVQSSRTVVGRMAGVNYLQQQGVDISYGQFRNWVGSGKVPYQTNGAGQPCFDRQQLAEVAKRYLATSGRAYSLYSSSGPTGDYFEQINTFQCSQLWNYGQRQVEKLIKDGVVRGRRVGNEYFVPRQEAERYQSNPKSYLVYNFEAEWGGALGG